MTSFEEFANELRAFDGKREVVNEIRKDLRKGVPELRSNVRKNAVAILPAGGGLGAWVAKAAFTVRFQDTGRRAGVRIKVSRKSGKGKAALTSLDETGSVRHPRFGHRDHWYSQRVAENFFTSQWEKAKWLELAEQAFDRALQKIRG